jgi:Protein kinase domain
LTHPAIATVYDYGFQDDKPFTVFEYLPGETLRDLLQWRDRLPLEEVRLIVGPLAQALDFAHGHRVVHRDLKPENVRATEQGLFKVLDLGLAREFGRDIDWSGFAGTPAYASPEQASGLACDGRADEYALALIAFELLTGRRLFQARDWRDMLAMHRQAEPAALATYLADASEAVRLALARALSKDPNARFATCGDFAVALGCQLLSAPAPAPEILLEADVERMTVGRLIRQVSLPWQGNAVRLALTREAIWSAYHTEISRLPLAATDLVEGVVKPSAGSVCKTDADDDEDVRRSCLDAEAQIRGIGEAHRTVFWLVVFILAILIGSAIFDRLPPRSGPISLYVIALAAVGTWFFTVTQGLRRRSSWARWAAVTESQVVLLAAAWIVVLLLREAFSLPSRSSDRLSILLIGGLVTGPVIALALYVGWMLLRRKATVVFSASYGRVIEQTPQLDPKNVSLAMAFRPARRTLRLTLRVPGGAPSRVAIRFGTGRRAKTLGIAPCRSGRATERLDRVGWRDRDCRASFGGVAHAAPDDSVSAARKHRGSRRKAPNCRSRPAGRRRDDRRRRGGRCSRGVLARLSPDHQPADRNSRSGGGRRGPV